MFQIFLSRHQTFKLFRDLATDLLLKLPLGAEMLIMTSKLLGVCMVAIGQLVRLVVGLSMWLTSICPWVTLFAPFSGQSRGSRLLAHTIQYQP